MSGCFPKSQAGCPHGQLLRQKAQRFKVIVETVKLPAKNFFIVLFFLLQRGNFVDPPLHDAGAAAAALNEIVGLFLIQRDLFLDGRIKFLRHFVALLGIVNDVKVVDAQSVVILVYRAELLNERLKRIHFVHVLTRDKIQMSSRADLGGLQHRRYSTDVRSIATIRFIAILFPSPYCSRITGGCQLSSAVISGT